MVDERVSVMVTTGARSLTGPWPSSRSCRNSPESSWTTTLRMERPTCGAGIQMSSSSARAGLMVQSVGTSECWRWTLRTFCDDDTWHDPGSLSKAPSTQGRRSDRRRGMCRAPMVEPQCHLDGVYGEMAFSPLDVPCGIPRHPPPQLPRGSFGRPAPRVLRRRWVLSEAVEYVDVWLPRARLPAAR